MQRLVLQADEEATGAQWTFVVDRSPAVLGRGPSSSITLDRPQIPGMLGVFRHDEFGATYTHLGKDAAVSWDGESPFEVGQTVPLKDAAVLRLPGGIRLECVGPDRAPRDNRGANPFAKPPAPKSGVLTSVGGPLPGSPATFTDRLRDREPLDSRVQFPAEKVVPIVPLPPPAVERSARSEKASDGRTKTEAARLAPGTKLGRYEVRKFLAKGGMGTVYRGWDPITDRPVAIKVLAADLEGNRDAQDRFLIEARASSRIDSVHVVRVHDVGDERGLPYIVMELLRGMDLADYLAEFGTTGLTVSEAIDLGCQLCRGMDAAHALGVLHRDLKPKNLYLAENVDGLHADGRVLKILDFGVAKLAHKPDAPQITGVGTIVGTALYMSPDQARGLSDIDGRSDIYTIGVILYEMVTGKRPFEEGTSLETVAKILQGDFVPPSTLRPELDPEIEGIILRAMALNREHRFQTVQELGAQLSRFASDEVRRAYLKYFSAPRARPVDFSSSAELRGPSAEGRLRAANLQIIEPSSPNPVDLNAPTKVEVGPPSARRSSGPDGRPQASDSAVLGVPVPMHDDRVFDPPILDRVSVPAAAEPGQTRTLHLATEEAAQAAEKAASMASDKKRGASSSLEALPAADSGVARGAAPGAKRLALWGAGSAVVGLAIVFGGLSLSGRLRPATRAATTVAGSNAEAPSPSSVQRLDPSPSPSSAERAATVTTAGATVPAEPEPMPAGAPAKDSPDSEQAAPPMVAEAPLVKARASKPGEGEKRRRSAKPKAAKLAPAPKIEYVVHDAPVLADDDPPAAADRPPKRRSSTGSKKVRVQAP